MQTGLDLAVVVVEDEPLLSLLLEDMLAELGCSLVASAATVADGLAAVEQHDFDFAVLDVHLGRELVWPLADILVNRSKPFVLASGGDGKTLQDRYPEAKVLTKPYELDSLTRALRTAARRHPAAPVNPGDASA